MAGPTASRWNRRRWPTPRTGSSGSVSAGSASSMLSASTLTSGRSDVTEQSGHVVRIERTFAASAEEVFAAWTSPEVMRRWFHVAPDWDTPVAEVDLRVGGKVRVVMRAPDGREVEAQGEYTLIERPHRLAMTWTFGDAPFNEQLIELSFSE